MRAMEFKKLEADIGGWDDEQRKDSNTCDEEITYRRKKTEKPREAITLCEFNSRSKKRRRTGSCWLCETASAGAKDGSSSGLARFFKLFTDNYRRCGEDELYKQLHELFIHDIYEPMLMQGHEIPKLTTSDIREHFLEHALDPSVYVSEEIKFLKQVAMTMKDHIFTEGAKKRMDVNDKRVWNYLKVQKQIVELYNTRLSQMNFFDVTTSVCK